MLCEGLEVALQVGGAAKKPIGKQEIFKKYSKYINI